MPISLGYWPYSLTALFLGAVGYFFWRWRSDRLLLLAGGWYALSISVVLAVNSAYAPSAVADRFMYLPSLGFCFWVGAWVANRLARPVVQVSVGVVLLSLSVMTFYQCHIWQNSETLWTYVIQHYPDRWLAYYDRGLSHGAAGRYDLALKDHTMALAFCRKPLDEANTYYARGLDHRHLADRALSAGRKSVAQRLYRLAEQDFNQVVRLGYARVLTYQQRGKARFQLGELSGAVSDFSIVIQLDAQNAEALIDRGEAYAAMGDLDRALRDLNRAIDLEPSSSDGYESRGVVFCRMGRMAESLADLDKALQLDPQYGQAYYDRSVVKFNQGDLPGALRDALRARNLGVAVAEEYFQKLVPSVR
jgi:tetratricopeptide (TPR) repeat protein